jgi:hypothetical protein
MLLKGLAHPSFDEWVQEFARDHWPTLLTLRVLLASETTNVLLSIRDNDIGIPQRTSWVGFSTALFSRRTGKVR